MQAAVAAVVVAIATEVKNCSSDVKGVNASFWGITLEQKMKGYRRIHKRTAKKTNLA